MAIPWLIRQRIRINPNSIINLADRDLTEEVIEFAFSQKRVNPYRIFDALGKNSSFVEKIIRTPFIKDNKILYLIFKNYVEYPENLKDQIATQVIGNNLPSNGIPTEIIVENRKLFKHFVKTDWNSIQYLIGTVTDFSDFTAEELKEFHDDLRANNIGLMSLPEQLRTNPLIADTFFDADFQGTIQEMHNHLRYSHDSEKMTILAKQYLMNHLNERISDFHLLNMLDGRGLFFTYRERELVIEAARKGKFTFRGPKTEVEAFLHEDQDVVFNAIMNIEDIGMLEYFNLDFKFTPEQEDKIAEKIASLTTDKVVKSYPKIYASLIEKQKAVMERAVEKKINIIDYLQNTVFYYPKLDVPQVEDGQYVVNHNTPASLLIQNKKFFIEQLRKNFRRVIELPSLRGEGLPAEYDHEDLRTIYEIAKANNYRITENSPYFLTNNRFFVVEQILRGERELDSTYASFCYSETLKPFVEALNNSKTKKISDSEFMDFLVDSNYLLGRYPFYYLDGIGSRSYELITTTEFALKCIKKNFLSIINVSRFDSQNCSISSFSQEQLQEIALEYEKAREMYTPNIIRRLNMAEYVYENPYIVLNCYRRDGTIPYDSVIDFPDELYREVANIFKQRNNVTLLKSSYYIEKSNPYIVIESIRKDPRTIDYIIGREIFFNDEIKAEILRCINDGTYTLGPETPKNIFSYREVVDYILENERLDCLKYIHFSRYENEKELLERAKKALFDGARKGLVIDGKINLSLTQEEILQLCYLNPNYAKFLKIDDLLTNEEFKNYILRSVDDGTLVIDEKLGYTLWGIEGFEAALMKKPENFLHIEEYIGENREELKQLLISAVDNDTLIVDDNINISIFFDFGKEEMEKCVNYVINKNPKCIYSIYRTLADSNNLRAFPQVKNMFLEQIRNGEIVVDDDFPDKIINGPFDVMIECLKQNKSLKRKINRIEISELTEEQVVQLRELLEEDFERIVINEEPVIGERRNVELNPARILQAAKENPQVLYDINPAMSYNSYNKKAWDELIQIALQNNYVINANSPLIFRTNNELILKSIQLNPESIQYVIPQNSFRPAEQRQILTALFQAERPIVLNRRSMGFLRYNEQYINFSLDNATDENIQEVIDSIEYRSLTSSRKALRERILTLIDEGKYNISTSRNPDLIRFMGEDIESLTRIIEADVSILKLELRHLIPFFNREEQERIYKAYLEREEEFATDEEMHKIMMDNSFYVMDYLMKNPSMVEQIDLRRFCLSDDFITFFRNYYLDNNLPVTESFPDFLRDDKEFVFQYIVRNNGNLNGLRLNDVEPLLDFATIHDHPEYLQLADFYERINSPYNEYIEKWGKEKAFFFAQRIGGLIRYLDPDQDYEYENVKNDFTNMLLNRNNLTQGEIVEILSAIDIELPESFFATHSYLNSSDELFLAILKNNPNRIREYTGKTEAVFQMAIDSGLQLTDEILTTSAIRNSVVIFKKILEEDVDLFEKYQGDDLALIQEAMQRGFFDGRTDEDIVRIIRGNSLYSTNNDIFGHLLDRYGKIVAESYNGRDSAIFTRIVESGYFDDKSEEDVVELLSWKNNFRDSDEIMSHLLDHYSPEVAVIYPGGSLDVFEKIIKVGFFEGKTEEDITKLLTEKKNFAQADVIISHLLENYPPEIVLLYQGSSFEVFQKAIDKGLKIDMEFFDKRPDLIHNSFLINEGIKNDKYCAGFLISDLVRGGVEQNSPEREQILGIVKRVIGEEEYSKIVTSPQMEKEIINLCTISDNPQLGVKLLKCMDSELLKEMGLEEWKKVIKYAFNNPDLNKLIEIVENKQAKEFMDLYKTLENLIDDDMAVGVNKFLKFARLFRENPEFMKAVEARVREGKELSEDEKTDFYMIMYGRDQTTRAEFKVEDLGHLTALERDKRLAKLGRISRYEMMTDLATFLFNADQAEISALLEHDIDSQTLIRIMKRAQKDGNRVLEQNCKYLYLLVDMIEQFNYTKASDEQLIDFARKVYGSDEEKLEQIRKSFSNIREVVRHFYEVEARSELTNVSELMHNPDFVEKDGDDLIVDLSKTRHTLYGHVLGTSLDAFFTTDRGKVTICVSPITDKHEAFYYGGGIVLGFDSVPRGAFIGSSTQNMGSNGSISNNDYSDERVRQLFAQTSIRNSYDGDAAIGHAETLLYRQDLVPSCIIMMGETPTDGEREARAKLEKLINGDLQPGDPNYKVIPLVRTQRERNRVFKYEKSVPKEMLETETGNRQEERIDELRKKFSSIIEFPAERTFMRKAGRGNSSSDSYVIVDDTVFVLKPGLTPREVGAIKAGARVQKLVHKDDEEAIIDVRDFQVQDDFGNPTTVTGVKDIDARSMWLYNRGNGRLSHKSNQMFLREFLVDHLLCNYDSENSAFLMDSDETVYGVEKKEAGRAIGDFITEDGEVYTDMSYLYFDSNAGNNIYRKIFEGYINAPEGEQTLTDEDLEEFVATAEEIAQMDDKEYLNMYEEMLDGISDEMERENLRKVLLARKNNAGKDSRKFVDRLKRLRQIEQEPEVIENPDSIALINDIHGNVEALQALLDECRRSGKKDIFILGDMIGFGPQSNECLDLLRQSQEEFNIRCVLGNHELYSLMGNKSFAYTAGFQTEMTTRIRQTMSPENRRFIEELPITRRAIIGGKKVTFTHFPIQESYEDDSRMYVGHGEGESAFAHSESGRNQDIVIYGHEHRTESTMGDDVGTVGETTVTDTTYVNLPSSGCVHGNKTSFVTFTLGEDGIKTQVHTVDYERERLQEALLKTNNPNAHFFGGIKESGETDGER